MKKTKGEGETEKSTGRGGEKKKGGSQSERWRDMQEQICRYAESPLRGKKIPRKCRNFDDSLNSGAPIVNVSVADQG